MTKFTEFVDAWFEFQDDPEAQMDYAAEAMQYFDDDEFFQVLKMIDDKRRESMSKQYMYLVTFTIDPSKHPQIDQALEDKIVQYIHTIPTRPALNIIKCSYVRELHKSGRPHYHVKIVTTKSLRSDAFITYTKSIGNVDISRSKHTNDESHIDFYLSKENPKIDLL